MTFCRKFYTGEANEDILSVKLHVANGKSGSSQIL